MARPSIRFPSIAAALLLLVCASVGHAAEPIRGTLKADPGGEVAISVVRGQVTIIGGDGDEVTVAGTRDAASERFVFERDGDTVIIEDKLARRPRAGAGTQLTVRLPRDSRLRVQLVSADLDLQGVNGAVRSTTVSGAVAARALGDEVEVVTVSGRVNLEGAGGKVRLQTVSGPVHGELAATRLNVKTVSGAVTLTNRQPLVLGRLSSVSGDLTLRTPLDPDCDVGLETVSGDAALTLTGPLNLRLELAGAPGGRIRNQLNDAPVLRQRPAPGERLETRLGDGRGYLRASTISGTLTVAGD